TRGPGGAVVRRAAVAGLLVETVLGPFPDIAEQVVETEGVGGKAPDRCSIGMAVAAGQERPCSGAGRLARGGQVGPVAIDADRAPVTAEPERRIGPRRCPRPGGVSPLRLREQPIAFAGLLGEPFHIGPGIAPTQTGRRIRSILRIPGIAPGAVEPVVE